MQKSQIQNRKIELFAQKQLIGDYLYYHAQYIPREEAEFIELWNIRPYYLLKETKGEYNAEKI